MKLKARGAEFVEIDYTPMIDMTFQLIAFFMILINFSEMWSRRAFNPHGSARRPRFLL